MSSSGDSSGNSTSSQSGGADIEGAEIEDESSFPNERYYVLRLQDKDPKLINYTSSQNDKYARKCQSSPDDKQPIVLSKGDLLEIDRITNKINSADQLRKKLMTLSKELLLEEARNSISEDLVTKYENKEVQLIDTVVKHVASYAKAYRIEGQGREKESNDTLYFICPKYWDRKHQIPLNPINKIHPIRPQ